MSVLISRKMLFVLLLLFSFLIVACEESEDEKDTVQADTDALSDVDSEVQADIDPEVQTDLTELAPDAAEVIEDDRPFFGAIDLSAAVAVEASADRKPDGSELGVHVLDINGDGVQDLVLGGGAHEGETPTGTLWLHYGPIDGARGPEEADVVIRGDEENDLGCASGTCHSVSAGDINGDGTSDLIVGAPSIGASNGRVGIFFGPVSGEHLLSEADITLTSSMEGWVIGEALGGKMAVADLNDDGALDLVTVDNSNSGDINVRQLLVIFGPITESRTFDNADLVIAPTAEEDTTLGKSLRVFDTDGDGKDDILLTANNADEGNNERGAVYIFRGPFSAGALTASDADAVLLGTSDNATYSTVVANGGNLTGSASPVLLVGLSEHSSFAKSSPEVGSVYVVDGSITGEVELPSSALHVLEGEESAYFGYALTDAADIDGDGIDDLLIRGNYGGDLFTSAVYETYLFYGPIDANRLNTEAEAILSTNDSSIGDAGIFLRDIDADGDVDMVLGDAQPPLEEVTRPGAALLLFNE